MRKTGRLITMLAVLVVLLAIIYRVVNRVPSENAEAHIQAKEILMAGDCLVCHSAGSEAPFYAEFPVIGSLVKEDITKGLRHADLSDVMDAMDNDDAVGEVTLAKIEKVVEDGTMPPSKYYLVHWGSSISKIKKEILLNWIARHRATHYYTGIAADAFRNEPVQPVVDSIPVDLRKVMLGEMLFHDPRLSADNTISCASCHDLGTAGVDNEQYSDGVNGQLGGVNAPTVFNAVFNFVQFWDGRAATLAEQAAGPPLNPVEMACNSFDEIIARLEEDRAFTNAFLQVYPEGYSQETITDAIQEFEKTLITPNCRFDRHLKGESDAITADERIGYDLFKQYNCATCHVGVNLGGQSYELMGQMADYFADRDLPLTEEDHGRYKQTKIGRDKHRFKVPGLRNVALTAPYFHDGTLKTLDEAVDFMARYQLGYSLPEWDRDKIVAFLNTLTGEYQGKPLVNKNMEN